jgi:hypothetical protein
VDDHRGLCGALFQSFIVPIELYIGAR